MSHLINLNGVLLHDLNISMRSLERFIKLLSSGHLTTKESKLYLIDPDVILGSNAELF